MQPWIEHCAVGSSKNELTTARQAIEKLRPRPPSSVAQLPPMLTHMLEYAAIVASPRTLSDGLILVFQHPVKPDP